MKSVAVVTATTGRDTLFLAAQSVKEQTHLCTHYVVVDGPECGNDLRIICLEERRPDCHVVVLPKPTGGNKIMNGAILAMAAYLCTEEYLCFLDDDNWLEPNHVESLLAAMEEKNTAYAYCLRNLINPDGSFYAQDNGESIGHHGEFVDANCYMFRRDLAVGLAPLWIKTNETMNVSDRYVWAALQQNKIPHAATGLYTVNYRISSRGADMKPFFFLKNIQARARHPDGFPWAQSA